MMLDFSPEELFAFLLQEVDANFNGWDCSYLEGREDQAPLPWSYVSTCLLRVRKAQSVLDMETGGGELFSRFAPFQGRAWATEAYPPNIQLARQRLEPLGVQVLALEEDEPKTLPFDPGSFDLVLNRHGYYWAPEVSRILRIGGQFITQQVGDRNDIGIRALLGAPDDSQPGTWDLSRVVGDLDAAGLKILQKAETINRQRFYDVGAIVYQLRAIPWQIPDFSVDRYFDKLWNIHAQIQRTGFVDVQEHRFWIVAERC